MCGLLAIHYILLEVERVHSHQIILSQKGSLDYDIINIHKYNELTQPKHLWYLLLNLPKDFDGHIIDITNLFVEENARGRGVATNLLSTLIRLYKDDIICANINPNSIVEFSALKQYHFYHDRGFKSIGNISKNMGLVPMLYTNNAVGKAIRKRMISS